MAECGSFAIELCNKIRLALRAFKSVPFLAWKFTVFFILLLFLFLRTIGRSSELIQTAILTRFDATSAFPVVACSTAYHLASHVPRITCENRVGGSNQA